LDVGVRFDETDDGEVRILDPGMVPQAQLTGGEDE